MSWTLIKQGQENNIHSNYCEFQLDSASDISNPSDEANKAAPNSKAYLGDLTKMYNKKNDGTWVEV